MHSAAGGLDVLLERLDEHAGVIPEEWVKVRSNLQYIQVRSLCPSLLIRKSKKGSRAERVIKPALFPASMCSKAAREVEAE